MNIQGVVGTDHQLSVSKVSQIVGATAGKIGEDFFPAAAQAIAEAVGVRWVLISKLDRTDSQVARTVVAWDNGPSDNMVYALAGSPCENILTQGSCCHSSGLQESFPEDTLLQDMGAHAYVGTPLWSSTGKVLGLIAALHDTAISNEGEIAAAIELIADRTAAELERLSARSLNERLGRIVEDSVSEAYVFSGETFRFELVNRGARENLGYTMEELESLTPWDLKPAYTEEQFKDYVAPLVAGKVSDLRFETIHKRKDGTQYDVDVRLQYFPGADNVFFASITDITERKDAELREKLLAREVNHRSKNLLSLIQVIARQTASRHPEDYVERLEERIAALSANQDVLVNNCWQKIPLARLVETQLQHLGGFGERLRIRGADIEVKPQAAQTIGMAVHELSTNAVKHGALSGDSGSVDIAWSTEADGRIFALSWSESGGPEVSVPTETGFGSVVIVRQPQAALGAEVTIDFRPEGLHYTIRAPSDRVLDHGSSEAD